jgi:hypothetical protein
VYLVTLAQRTFETPVPSIYAGDISRRVSRGRAFNFLATVYYRAWLTPERSTTHVASDRVKRWDGCPPNNNGKTLLYGIVGPRPRLRGSTLAFHALTREHSAKGAPARFGVTCDEIRKQRTLKELKYFLHRRLIR